MTIANDSLIVANDLNVVFSDAPTGLSEGLDAQRDLNNGYTSFRFRVKNPVQGVENKKTFVSPDDFDIYLAGVCVNLGPGSMDTFQGPVDFTAKISGSTGDFETDLPTNDNLFLMEPISNADGKDHMVLAVQTLGLSTRTFDSARYVTYDLNNNRPCNTLLKGSEYDVTLTMIGDIYSMVSTLGGNITECNIDVFILCKAKLRRN